MSSQLNVDTIVDKAGSGGTNVKIANTSTYVSDGGGATQNTVQGLVKAWSFTAADGASISDSFNISSLGDTAAGQQTLNFNNDFGSANHSVVASQGTGNQHDVVMSTKAAGTQLIKIYDPDAGAFQDSLINAVAHGDLA